jgi:hypothetical protein
MTPKDSLQINDDDRHILPGMAEGDHDDAQSLDSEIQVLPKSRTAQNRNRPSCSDESPLNPGFNITLPTSTLGHISAPVSGPTTLNNLPFVGPQSPEKSVQKLTFFGSFNAKLDSEKNTRDRGQAQENFRDPIWSTNSVESEEVQHENDYIKKATLSGFSKKLQTIQEPIWGFPEPS